MERSPNLDLPFLMPSQAQKHVTHNEALSVLDALVHCAVESRVLGAPPASPAEGQRYLVATGAPKRGQAGTDRSAPGRTGGGAFIRRKLECLFS